MNFDVGSRPPITSYINDGEIASLQDGFWRFGTECYTNATLIIRYEFHSLDPCILSGITTFTL